MSPPVFFFEPAAETSAGSEVVLDDDEGHHAATVKRLRVGEATILTDGRGTSLGARVTQVGRREVHLLVEHARRVERPGLWVTVVQAIAKGDRGERAVELMTEIGVSRIVPWQAERSVSRWEDKADKARAKWQSTADAAAKQSRRVWWPRVDELADLTAVADLATGAERAFVLHGAAEHSFVAQLDGLTPASIGEVLLVVGPEGGLTDNELAALAASGATPVRLGQTVLRTSTAGVVAATLALASTQQWRGAPTTQGADRD